MGTEMCSPIYHGQVNRDVWYIPFRLNLFLAKMYIVFIKLYLSPDYNYLYDVTEFVKWLIDIGCIPKVLAMRTSDFHFVQGCGSCRSGKNQGLFCSLHCVMLQMCAKHSCIVWASVLIFTTSAICCSADHLRIVTFPFTQPELNYVRLQLRIHLYKVLLLDGTKRMKIQMLHWIFCRYKNRFSGLFQKLQAYFALLKQIM